MRLTFLNVTVKMKSISMRLNFLNVTVYNGDRPIT